VVRLFGRRRASGSGSPRLRGRREGSERAVNHVGLAELTPDVERFLGQAAYFQLAIFQTLTRSVLDAQTIAAKEAVTRAAGLSLARHQGLVAEIERSGRTASEAMAAYAEPIDAFQLATRGADWYETLVTSYVTAGILNELYLHLAEGLPDEYAGRMVSLMSGDEQSRLLAGVLREAIDANPHLASRLALWGRRLVGDTLLIARSALAVPENTAPDDARLEPVFTQLIAAHTRRMDNLGLTA
jgi:hypothetical protein